MDELENIRTVAAFSYDWQYWISSNGDILYCSPACFRITGYSRAEFIKTLAYQHGGDIWHEAKHNGSDFVFTLPK